MDADMHEQLVYLMRHTAYDIDDLVEKVLNDDEKDPEYSAVTAVNMLTCYIHVMRRLGEEVPYANVEEYFAYSWRSPEEYRRFIESARKESAYYHGRIFDEAKKNIGI